MNDIVLKGASVKRELTILLVSFILAFGVNMYAIIVYKTEWAELITSLGFVLILTLIIYVLVGWIRLIFKGAVALIKRRRK